MVNCFFGLLYNVTENAVYIGQIPAVVYAENFPL